MKIRTLLAASMLMLLSLGANAALLSYTAIDLGSVDGFETFGRAISNSGKVAGSYLEEFGNGAVEPRAVIGDASGLTSIHQLGNASVANGVNSAGQAVGLYRFERGGGRSANSPFVFENGVMHDPGKPADVPPYENGELNDINEAGISVGSLRRSDGRGDFPYVYDVASNSWHELDTIDRGGRAIAINERGQIAGNASVRDPDSGTFTGHAVRWDSITGEAEDLGTFGNLGSSSSDINNFGAVIGTYNDDGTTGSFLNFGGSMIDIGIAETFDNSAALGINDLFQVVGWGRQNGQERGLYWDPIQGWLDLTSLVSNLDVLGWLAIDVARDINDRGQITGYATLADGRTQHAFILNPVLAVPSPVPVPAAVWLFGTGLLGLIGVKWRRKAA